jgi:hypothetical protein
VIELLADLPKRVPDETAQIDPPPSRPRFKK